MISLRGLALGIIPHLFILTPFNLRAQALDPHLKIFQQLRNESKIQPSQVGVGKGVEVRGMPQENTIVGVFIKTSDLGALQNFIQQNSGEIHSIIGDIVTAQVPFSLVPMLNNVSGVIYVELGQPMERKLNVSTPMIGALDVQRGSLGLPPYTGRGVIVGIVDSGIDYKHSDFIENANSLRSRVKFIWDQTLTPRDGFVGPREMIEAYGLECVERDLDAGASSLCPSRDTHGHGTHVAGIAGGSDNVFKGVAPASEIIAVKIPELEEIRGDYTPSLDGERAFSTHVVDGVNYVFQKAQVLGMPAVVNLSSGTHFGPHDSTSLFEQALNSLVNNGASPGRAIVAAAGNEAHISGSYSASLHAGFSLQGETAAVEFASGYPILHALILDIWQAGESALSFGVGVDSYGKYEKTEIVAPGGGTDFMTQDGRLRVLVNASETNNPLNGKKHTVIYVVAANGNDGVTIAASKYTFDLIISGTGNFDAWLARGGVFTKRSGVLTHTGYTYRSGDSQRTIAVPATAANVFSVGSYVSRNNFNNINSLDGLRPGIESLVVGNVSSFSSIGPTVDPQRTGQKPEIVAPGEWIFSAMSSQASSRFPSSSSLKSRSFVLMAGTSMAAPHVTGAVALLFERNPQMTAAGARLALCRTTGGPADESDHPNTRWGYGRLNVARTVTLMNDPIMARALAVANEPVAELPYDGGTADSGNVGVAASLSLSREFPDAPEMTNVPVSESKSDPQGDFLEDSLEPMGGGCFLGMREKTSSSTADAAVILLTVLFLFLLRVENRLRRFILLLLLLMALSHCGGGGVLGGPSGDSGTGATTASQSPSSGGSNNSTSQPAPPITLLSSLSLSNQQAAVFLQEGWVAVATGNYNRTKRILMLIPLKHFFANETISLGADGLYGQNPDEGFLVIEEGNNLGSDNAEISSVHVSMAGSISLRRSPIENGYRIEGSFDVRQIAPLDLKRSLIQRDPALISLNSGFQAWIIRGGTSSPFAVDYSPKEGEIGSTVTFKGFNFGRIRQVRFKNCPSQSQLPYRIVSENELVVTVDQYGCAFSDGFYLGSSWESYSTADEFKVKIPWTKHFQMTGVTSLSRSVFDSVQNRVYFLLTPNNDRWGKDVAVFSLPEDQLLETLYLESRYDEIDTTGDQRSLFISRMFNDTPMTYSLDEIGNSHDPVGLPVRLGSRLDGRVAFGKSRKALVESGGGLRLLDLDSQSIQNLPAAQQTSFASANDDFLRSPFREFVVVNRRFNIGQRQTVVYRSLDNGDFAKLSSVAIAEPLFGIAESVPEFWSANAVYDVNLNRLAVYGADLPNWGVQNAVGVIFDPASRYAILISKKGVLHILERATRRVLASNVPVLNVQNRELLKHHFLGSDGTKLILTSNDTLHVVDLISVFASVGLEY